MKEIDLLIVVYYRALCSQMSSCWPSTLAYRRRRLVVLSVTLIQIDGERRLRCIQR